MGEHGNSFHVRGASPEQLVELLAQLPKPSVILDTENQQYLPFVASAELETLKKLIPFPLLHYYYHDDGGFGVFGYLKGEKIFEMILGWWDKVGQTWEPGDPDVHTKSFERPPDKELMEAGFFESPGEIAKIVEVIANFTQYDDGSTEEDWERDDFDWSAYDKAHYAHQYALPHALGLTEFFNVRCSDLDCEHGLYSLPEWCESFPNHLLVSGPRIV